MSEINSSAPAKDNPPPIQLIGPDSSLLGEIRDWTRQRDYEYSQITYGKPQKDMLGVSYLVEVEPNLFARYGLKALSQEQTHTKYNLPNSDGSVFEVTLTYHQGHRLTNGQVIYNVVNDLTPTAQGNLRPRNLHGIWQRADVKGLGIVEVTHESSGDTYKLHFFQPSPIQAVEEAV